VRKLGFAVGCSYFGDHILTATTMAGCLQLSYCVVVAAIPLSEGERIASKTIEFLQGAARDRL
jgi:hypothetical protein